MATRDGVPMLTDFGVSRAVQYTLTILKTTTYHQLKGTVNWMAPEVVECFTQATAGDLKEIRLDTKSDMWAFGMAIYVCSHRSTCIVYLLNLVQEIISGGMIPYGDIKGPYADFQVIYAIKRGDKPHQPEKLTPQAEWLWTQICNNCWTTPDERLAAKMVIKSTSKYLNLDDTDAATGYSESVYTPHRDQPTTRYAYYLGGLGLIVSAALLVYRSF